jgi:hypothetical protein
MPKIRIPTIKLKTIGGRVSTRGRPDKITLGISVKKKRGRKRNKRGPKSKKKELPIEVEIKIQKKKNRKKSIRKNTPKENRGEVAKLARQQDIDKRESAGMGGKKGGRGVNEHQKSLHEYDTREWNKKEIKEGSAEPSSSVREAQRGGRYDSADVRYDSGSMAALEKELKSLGGFEIIGKAHGGQVRGWGKARKKGTK